MEIMDNTVQNDDRVIYLGNEVNNESISDVCKKILDINHIDQLGSDKFRNYPLRPIQLHVQSFGGSIHDMWALIDVIESSSTPIITYCTGYCMSAAALIFLAGHARFMYKHSCMMFHQIWTMNMGKINDVVLEQKQSEKMHKEIIKYIKKKTKLGDNFYKKFDKNKEDIYFTAKECLKKGICDKIIENTNYRDILLEQLVTVDDEEITVSE